MDKNKTKYIIKNFQLSLAVTCALYSSMDAGVCGHFELEDFDLKQHQAHYNSLPSVEESDRNLKQANQFQSFLVEAEEIVTRYELEQDVGLRLIHRHFTLGDNQIMTEGYETIDEVPSLVTYAHKFEEAKEKGVVPASWIFSDNSQHEVFPFETSNDPAVKASHLKLQKFPEFFNEMGEILRKHNLNNLLSIAILKRDSLLASDNQRYMEVNSLAKGSVVQLINETDSPLNTIRTSWSFKGPRQQNCLVIWQCLDGHSPNILHIYVPVGHQQY